MAFQIHTGLRSKSSFKYSKLDNITRELAVRNLQKLIAQAVPGKEHVAAAFIATIETEARPKSYDWKTRGEFPDTGYYRWGRGETGWILAVKGFAAFTEDDASFQPNPDIRLLETCKNIISPDRANGTTAFKLSTLMCMLYEGETLHRLSIIMDIASFVAEGVKVEKPGEFPTSGHGCWNKQNILPSIASHFKCSSAAAMEVLKLAIDTGMLQGEGDKICSHMDLEMKFVELAQEAMEPAGRIPTKFDRADKQAVVDALNGPHPIVSCVAKAGTGKSYLAGKICADYTDFVVVSTAGSAVEHFKRSAGLPKGLWDRCVTLKKYLVSPRIPEHSLLILEEAGMMGYDGMEAAVRAMARGIKVLLIGDYRQLKPIDAGDLLREAMRLCPWFDLSFDFRQDASPEALELRKMKEHVLGEAKHWGGGTVWGLPETPKAWLFEHIFDHGLAFVTLKKAEAMNIQMARAWLPHNHDFARAIVSNITQPIEYADDSASQVRWKADSILGIGRKGQEVWRCAPCPKELVIRWNAVPHHEPEVGAVYTGFQGVIQNGCAVFVTDKGNPKAFTEQKTRQMWADGKIVEHCCINTHKSQGQEYDHVCVITNGGTDIRALYTAISRSKKSVKLVHLNGKPKVRDEVARDTWVSEYLKHREVTNEK